MKTIQYKALLLLLILITSQFVFGQKLSKKDLSSMYSEYYFTTFDAMIHHSSDEYSTIYLNIHLNQLTYVNENPESQVANFAVMAALFPGYNAKNPIDTTKMVFLDREHAGEEIDMAIDFKVKAAFPGNYVLRIELIDLNQPENSVFKFIHIFKENKFSGQNFFITDEFDYPLFGGHVMQDTYFRIAYPDTTAKQLIIRYYDKNFPIAKPPFVMEKNVTYTFEPDSFYTIPLDSGLTGLLELPHQGIYFIQTKLSDPDGMTLYRFDDGFPEVNIPAQALAPLRYLSTSREFDQMLEYTDYKTAVDSFWLERASYKPERAKNMIKKFYQRVVDVNHLFTSYQEGWKTDRGLIYIIYGPPSEVYRKDGEEEWIYGERGNHMSIRLYFSKVDNPFTTNDYSLQRSPVYKTSWYVAIENWRR